MGGHPSGIMASPEQASATPRPPSKAGAVDVSTEAACLFALAIAVDEAPAEEAPEELPGDSIGPYQLVEKLGEGGFGIVWKAEQSRPIRRQVAVKVLRPGMDSRAVLHRFRAEQRALE